MSNLTLFIIYYIIGIFVSAFFIYRYRYSKQYKTKNRKSDAFLGLIGPFIWPFQIFYFIFLEFKNAL